jgi:hypothetical protein
LRDLRTNARSDEQRLDEEVDLADDGARLGAPAAQLAQALCVVQELSASLPRVRGNATPCSSGGQRAAERLRSRPPRGAGLIRVLAKAERGGAPGCA